MRDDNHVLGRGRLNYDDRLRAHAQPYMHAVEIVAFSRLQNGGRQVASIQWEPIADNSEMKPTLTISMDQAQVLMDDLWNSGVRPTDGAGSAGAMRAAERHIEDLRAIAFKTLGIGSG